MHKKFTLSYVTKLVTIYVFSIFFLFFSTIAEVCANAAIPITESLADTVEKITPAVVSVLAVQKTSGKENNPYDLFKEFFGRGFGVPDNFFEKEFKIPEHAYKRTALASGFLIDPTGYIVTNAHVIEGSEDISVTISDNSKTYKAKLIGKDQRTDLALLKIEAKSALPYLRLGDSDKLKVGDIVIAVGNPFRLGGTVTAGIVSAKSRYIGNNTLEGYIQTDAAINQGNSGGALCNTKGEVVGVPTAIMTPSGGSIGIGFAIPTSIVEPVIKQLKDNGQVARGWLGVKIQMVDEDIATSMELSQSKGALVADVVKDSPADKAGIKIGDIVTKFNDKEVSNMNKLPRMVGEVEVGKKVPVEIFRDSEYKTLQVIVEKPASDDPFNTEENKSDGSTSSEKASKKDGKKILGMSLKEMTNEMRFTYEIKDGTQGVVINQVDSESHAATIGIRPGDVIVRVNKQTIKTVSEFEKEVEKLKKAGKDKATLLVLSRGENYFKSVELH
ncbi:putative periplasmic serine endoprotease DegP-like [Alphaproteobacteria bacterium]